MNCRTAQQILLANEEGLLTGRKAQAFQAHLRTCAVCAQERDMIRQNRDILSALPRQESAGRAERAIAVWRMEQATSASAPPIRYCGRSLAAVGGVGLLAACVGLPLFFVARDGKKLAGRQHGTPPSDLVKRPPLPFGKPDSAPPDAGWPMPDKSFANGTRAVWTSPDGIRLGSENRTAAPPGILSRFSSETLRDDLAYVNADDLSALTDWTGISANDREALKAQIDRLAQGKDDFVEIPFPRVAGNGGKALAAAAAAYQKEKAVVDARLAKRVTLAAKSVAFADLCRQLRDMTGLDISAGRGAADEKVTLFCEEQPLRDIMRQITRTFGFVWLRDGDEGRYRYELIQSLRSQLTEEELRDKDYHEALIALDDAMKGYKPYLGLSVEKARERLNNGEEDRHLSQMAGDGWGGAQLYALLTPQDFANLSGGGSLEVHTENAVQSVALPPKWQQQVIASQNFLGQLDDFLKQGETHASIGLKINRSELGQISLDVDAAIYHYGKNGRGQGYSRDFSLATASSPSLAKPENAKANAAAQNDPALNKRIKLRPQPSCPVWNPKNEKERKATEDDRPHTQVINEFFAAHDSIGEGRFERGITRKSHVTSADVWEAVHQETGLPIIADSYTRLFPTSDVTFGELTVFDALCRAGDALGVRWKKEGAFLQCRRAGFFWDKQKEIPNRLLARWQQDSRRQNDLPLADLIEIASLADDQFNSTVIGDAVTHCWQLPEWDAVHGQIGYYAPRPFLRFLAGLFPEQRQAFARTEGAAVSDLPPAQQQQLLELAHKDLPIITTEPQQLAASRFRVDYVPSGQYFWMPLWNTDKQLERNALPMLAGKTAAEVLSAARKLDPSVTEKQVARSKGVLVVFQILPDGRAFQVAGVRPYIR